MARPARGPRSRPARAGCALAVAAALVAAGCTTTGGTTGGQGRFGGDPPAGPAGSASPAPRPTAAPATPTVAPVRFTDCTAVIEPQIADQPGGDRDLQFGCARLQVPRDYADPDAGTLPIFLLRARLGGQQRRIGSLVVNPGGPGGSGVDAAVGLGLRLSPGLLRRFDVVGFDPRGVGLSEPIECIPAELKDRATALDPDARTDAEYRAQVEVARSVAAGCARKYGAGLGQFGTEATARDLDLVRQAVGDRALNYLGYSYGTRIGAVYATLFPRRIRAMVLDGAVDPVAGEVAGAETQARGFENAFTQFAAACARRAGCPVGPDPRAAVTALLDRARRTPIRSSRPGERRTVTAGHILLAVISALYDQDDWSELETALADARGGDGMRVLALADRYNQRDPSGKYTNIHDANVTINCTDTAERVPDRQVKDLLARWRRSYPLFGPPLALGLLGCQQWTGPRDPPPPVRAAGAPPIVVVGTRNDPATPYASARVLTRSLASAVLLTWDGDGHTAYPKTRCVAAAVDAYLTAGRVPARGTICPG